MKNIRFRTGIAIVAVIFALAIVLDGFESRDRKANEILSQMQTEIDALNEQERFVDPSEVYRSVIEDNPELVLTKNGGLSKTYNPNIPLSRQEQKDLLAACKEFRISPDIALGLIEKETRFQNVTGDSGRSQGYMQIQRRWWKGLMAEIGASDLTKPKDNFRTGCAILRQLIDKSGGDVAKALTIYNAGHDHGGRSYANAVLKNAAKYR